MANIAKFKRPKRRTTPFTLFEPYEEGRKRNFKFNVNALADFEQETGMGFAQMMQQRAVFGSARAMIWAGLKHEDRTLTIETVGELLSDYLTDEDVTDGSHNIDAILMTAISAAVDQGALGRRARQDDDKDGDEQTVEGQVVKESDPNVPAGDTPAADQTPMS